MPVRANSYPPFTPATIVLGLVWTPLIAGVANFRIFADEVVMSNSGIVAETINLRDGAAGTIFTFDVAAGAVASFFPHGWVLGTGNALNARISAAGSVTFSGFYTITG